VNILKKIKSKFVCSLRELILKDRFFNKEPFGLFIKEDIPPDYYDWISSNIVSFSNEFIEEHALLTSYFMKTINITHETDRFDLLLKRLVVEYLHELLYDFYYLKLHLSERIVLEDNVLNRFAAEKYYAKFGAYPNLGWRRSPNLFGRISDIFMKLAAVFYCSLDKGLKVFIQRKKAKVMREAIWELYGANGLYFHDDFLVDGNNIQEKDLLLFSRGFPDDYSGGRSKAYHDAIASPYEHFVLGNLPLSVKSFFTKILSKYILGGSRLLLMSVRSSYYMLFSSLYLYFIKLAISYEKTFANYEVVSELGHSYFSPSHIAESIVCQNHNVQYCLMHWSDASGGDGAHSFSFLGCDQFLLWGNIHGQMAENDKVKFVTTGYVFKRFIKNCKAESKKILAQMGVDPKGKIISFFDESFGSGIGMTGEHYVAFWETALKLAMLEKDNTIIIKPKELERHKALSKDLQIKFLQILKQIKRLPNGYIINERKWSFIETIGVADIVITQGMTSSATIAIICGIEGLFLDQAQNDPTHPFARSYKNKLVFNDPDKLISRVQQIIFYKESGLSDIPESLLRAYDCYPDDRGIDLFRKILSSGLQR